MCHFPSHDAMCDSTPDGLVCVNIVSQNLRGGLHATREWRNEYKGLSSPAELERAQDGVLRQVPSMRHVSKEEWRRYVQCEVRWGGPCTPEQRFLSALLAHVKERGNLIWMAQEVTAPMYAVIQLFFDRLPEILPGTGHWHTLHMAVHRSPAPGGHPVGLAMAYCMAQYELVESVSGSLCSIAREYVPWHMSLYTPEAKGLVECAKGGVQVVVLCPKEPHTFPGMLAVCNLHLARPHRRATTIINDTVRAVVDSVVYRLRISYPIGVAVCAGDYNATPESDTVREWLTSSWSPSRGTSITADVTAVERCADGTHVARSQDYIMTQQTSAEVEVDVYGVGGINCDAVAAWIAAGATTPTPGGVGVYSDHAPLHCYIVMRGKAPTSGLQQEGAQTVTLE